MSTDALLWARCWEWGVFWVRWIRSLPATYWLFRGYKYSNYEDWIRKFGLGPLLWLYCWCYMVMMPLFQGFSTLTSVCPLVLAVPSIMGEGVQLLLNGYLDTKEKTLSSFRQSSHTVQHTFLMPPQTLDLDTSFLYYRLIIFFLYFLHLFYYCEFDAILPKLIPQAFIFLSYSIGLLIPLLGKAPQFLSYNTWSKFLFWLTFGIPNDSYSFSFFFLLNVSCNKLHF